MECPYQPVLPKGVGVRFPFADSLSAEQLVDELRRIIEQFEITHEESPFGEVTDSIGSALNKSGIGCNIKLLIALADETLYDANIEDETGWK